MKISNLFDGLAEYSTISMEGLSRLSSIFWEQNLLIFF
jgi:hypothetical protein